VTTVGKIKKNYARKIEDLKSGEICVLRNEMWGEEAVSDNKGKQE
jgi:hypothetical protein